MPAVRTGELFAELERVYVTGFFSIGIGLRMHGFRGTGGNGGFFGGSVDRFAGGGEVDCFSKRGGKQGGSIS